MDGYALKLMQSLPLELKIKKSERRITEWYDSHGGKIYPAFSGGVGSTVMLHIVRSIYPDMEAVFVNTGQERPDIVEFVKSTPNVTIIRPEHSYKWAIDNYGYPVVSKEVSKNISRYRNTKSEVQRQLRKFGGINPTSGKVQKAGVIPQKYHYLIDAPFKISDKCCEILKKRPFKKYNKETGKSPMTGEMASDSNKRKTEYLKHGCNYYGKAHKSTPLGFWTRQDILAYILVYNVPYCSAYGNIEYNPMTGLLYTTKEQFTGCYDCMFGCQMEDKENNRFTRMDVEDHQRWDICINKYGQGKVLDYMGIKYRAGA